MKYFNNICLYVMILTLASSCVDDDVLSFQVDKPATVAAQEVLNSYDFLKEYVDRTNNIDFKLGAGVTLSDYIDEGVMYNLVNKDFDEMTLGYAMKHGAVVQDDGSLDLTNIDEFLARALEAGVTVYGHTLCWHTNQNAGYLNDIIAPEKSSVPEWESIASADFETEDASNYSVSSNILMSYTNDGEGYGESGKALNVTTSAVCANDWDAQLYILFDQELEVGETYKLSIDIKADEAVSLGTQAQTGAGAYKHWNFFGSINGATEWTTVTATITVSDDPDLAGTSSIAINLGNYATSVYFDNFSITKYNEDGASSGPTWDNISDVDFESEDASNHAASDNLTVSYSADGDGFDGNGKALVITNSEVRANDWESQLYILFDEALVLGKTYKLSIDVKADEAVSLGTQAQTGIGSYKNWNFFGAISGTTEWTTVTSEITISEDPDLVGTSSIALNLGNYATTFYFDNFTVSVYNEEGSSLGGIELTDEVKKDTITYALETWISGMVTECKDYVTAWDAVNEPMSDASPYDLKSSDGEDDADEFYWQDYLGKDYAALVIKFARKYGNEGDKLFINDYNLEYSIDKCKGLIQFVEYTDNKLDLMGINNIDGIGTQMHISINSDTSKIVEMFNLLASTGKLIKISELDVGLDNVTTEDATDSLYSLQSDMYQFVVEKYFQIIPASQRYGITAWSPLDSPEGSSWRAGEPIGLWTQEYVRKKCYAGFANGLAGEDVSLGF